MLDYLKDYKIVPKSHTFDPVAVKFKLGKYQLVQVDNFLFCLSEGSDIVFRFKNESPYRTGHIHVSIMKKNRVICEHFYFVPTDLKHKMGTQIWQWFEHIVYLVQTSFYVLLEKRERNDVVNYLKNRINPNIRVQVIDNSRNHIPNYVFISMDISSKSSENSFVKEVYASLQEKSENRLMFNSYISNTTFFNKVKSRYAIKKIEYYKSLNEDVHYYEFTLTGNTYDTLTGNTYERVMVLYDTKKNKAKFTSLTYRHGEPVLKKRNIDIEPAEDFHINILNTLENLYLRKHPSDALISHFNDWHMDISNGLGEDHLAVLDMFEI